MEKGKGSLNEALERLARELSGEDRPELMKVSKGTGTLLQEVHDLVEKRSKELGLKVVVNSYDGRMVDLGLNDAADNEDEKEYPFSVSYLTISPCDERNYVAQTHAKGFSTALHNLSRHNMVVAD